MSSHQSSGISSSAIGHQFLVALDARRFDIKPDLKRAGEVYHIMEILVFIRWCVLHEAPSTDQRAVKQVNQMKRVAND